MATPRYQPSFREASTLAPSARPVPLARQPGALLALDPQLCYPSSNTTGGLRTYWNPMITTNEFLRSLPYFSGLSAEELACVRRCITTRDFDKGELVLLEGEPCRGLYVVRSGRVRVFKTSPDGREQVLRVAEAGETFNEVPNFDGGNNPASVEVLEPSTIYLIRRAHLLQLVQQYPSIAMALLRMFAGRLRHLTTLVEDLSLKNLEAQGAVRIDRHRIVITDKELLRRLA